MCLQEKTSICTRLKSDAAADTWADHRYDAAVGGGGGCTSMERSGAVCVDAIIAPGCWLVVCGA
jgi:hypothetical protein